MARVLVLCEHASLNGGERSLLGVVDRLSEMGFTLQIAGPAEGRLAAAVRATAAEMVPLDWSVADAENRLSVRRERLEACLRHQRPDLVHANSLAMSRMSGPVSRRLGLASLGHLRDMVRVSRSAARDIDCHRRLIAVSEAVRQWYIGAGIETRRIQVVYNGVDPRRFRPRPATGFLHRETGLPGGSRLIVSVGQIILRKGFDVLAAAARVVLAHHDDVHFLVVGSRFSDKPETVAYEAALHRAAAEPPLAGHFHFLGPRDDMEDVLAETALVAHPARQEPLGRVLLEAAAAGIPVVATAVGGSPEIFPPALHTAILVRAGDASELAAAIERLLADDRLRAQQAAAARQFVVSHFTIDAAARGLAKQYRATLAG